MQILSRRVAALVVTPLVAGTLALAPQTAHADVDRTPQAHSAATWLTDTVVDGRVTYDTAYGPYTDTGLSIDALLSLTTLGGYADTVQDIADAVQADAPSYTGTGGEVYANAVAKALVGLQAAGRQNGVVSGLLQTLEGTVQESGRIQDASQYGDYANTFGQAFAAQALDTAGSAAAGRVTDYLLGQQCSSGAFRLALGATTADCTAEGQSPDTDATAQAVLSLDQQADDADVAAALDRTETWLLDVQKADGSFGGGTSTEAPNVNSTALAALALDRLGATDAARSAAAWVADRQITTTHGCGTDLVLDRGAVAYDDATFTAGEKSGITDATFGQWFRSTAPAAAALGLFAAPEPLPATTLTVTPSRTGYVQAGSRINLAVTGLAASERVCVVSHVAPGAQADANGAATLPFTVRGGTGTQTVVVNGSRAARSGTVVLKALAAKRLTVDVRYAKLKKGATQTYTIRGLASGESVTLTLDGRSIRSAKASSSGVLTVSFTTGVAGRRTLKAVGQFANRAGSTTFTVTS